MRICAVWGWCDGKIYKQRHRVFRATAPRRHGDIALILMPNNDLTPYVVPVEHRIGTCEWWGGHYCYTLDQALNYYNHRVDELTDEEENEE